MIIKLPPFFILVFFPLKDCQDLKGVLFLGCPTTGNRCGTLNRNVYNWVSCVLLIQVTGCTMRSRGSQSSTTRVYCCFSTRRNHELIFSWTRTTCFHKCAFTCHIFCKAMVSMYLDEVKCHIVKFWESNCLNLKKWMYRFMFGAH